VLGKGILMKNFISIFSLITLLTVSVVSQAEIVYIHNDALGSPIMETNELGSVISRNHYKPFGETLEQMKDGVGYTGHVNDTDLGLTYMQARYYDPVIGRFYSNDPIGFYNIHNFNRYAYAYNNSYKYIDPDGKDASLYPKDPKTADPSDLKKEEKKKETKIELQKELKTHNEADELEEQTEKFVAIVQTLSPIVAYVVPPAAIPIVLANGAIVLNPITPSLHKNDVIKVKVSLKGNGMSLTDKVTYKTTVDHNHGK
jgi:RHS repeat-associated protein